MVNKILLQPKVTIIIVHIKDMLNLVDCIASLNDLIYENYNIVLVYNGSSSSDLLNKLTSVNKNLRKIINTEINLGFATANNIGIKEARNDKADYILLLNDDTIVAPEFLNCLVDMAEQNPDMGMLGPKIYYFDQPNRIWFAGAKFKEKTCQVLTPHSGEIDKFTNNINVIDSDYITGCSLLVREKILDKVGLLDERFFLYWEDVDWGLRLKKVKFKNAVVPSSKIWHKVSVSTGGPNSPLKVYHKTRSHLLFHKIHISKTNTKLMLKFGRDISWLMLKSSDQDRIQRARAYFSAIKDYYLGRTGKGPQWLWQNR